MDKGICWQLSSETHFHKKQGQNQWIRGEQRCLPPVGCSSSSVICKHRGNYKLLCSPTPSDFHFQDTPGTRCPPGRMSFRIWSGRITNSNKEWLSSLQSIGTIFPGVCLQVWRYVTGWRLMRSRWENSSSNKTQVFIYTSNYLPVCVSIIRLSTLWWEVKTDLLEIIVSVSQWENYHWGGICKAAPFSPSRP